MVFKNRNHGWDLVLVPIRHTRKQQFAEDPHCSYCGRETSMNLDSGLARTTVDHIRTISEGGTDAPTNLVLACFDCNTRRGSKRIVRFLREINAREET